jgi:hypothetical protein
LDDPSLDVGACFAQFTAAVRAAVPSFTGMSITVAIEGVPVTVTAPAREDDNEDDTGDDNVSAAEAAASLLIPLTAITSTAHGELVLYASAPGAFVDLAADLAYANATDLVTFALDSRLGTTAALVVSAGGLSVVHQAIGMLIERGRTPDEARAHLAEIAANDGHNLAAAAERITTGEER